MAASRDASSHVTDVEPIPENETICKTVENTSCSMRNVNARRLQLRGKSLELSTRSTRLEFPGDLTLDVSYDCLTSDSYRSLSSLKDNGDFTGMHDWDGASLLGTFVGRYVLRRGTPSRVMELGCGGSSAGLALAKLDADGLTEVVLTDYSEDVLSLARHNVKHHLSDDTNVHVDVRRVDWSDASTFEKTAGGFDCVFGSELLYYVTRVSDLATCALHHMSPSKGVFVLFSNIREQNSAIDLYRFLVGKGLVVRYLHARSILDWVRFDGQMCLIAGHTMDAIQPWIKGYELAPIPDCDDDDDW